MLRERFGGFLAKDDGDPGMIIDKDDIISPEGRQSLLIMVRRR